MTWSYGVGRYHAAERDVLGWPEWYRQDRTVPGIVFAHGHGGIATSFMNPAGQPNLFKLLAALATRWPIVSCDYGDNTGTSTGVNSWGNSNGQSRVAEAITYLQQIPNGANNWAGGGAKLGKVGIIGFSHGGMLEFQYTKNNPANVSCAVGLEPCSDADDIRNLDRGGLRDSINNALGLTAGSTADYPAHGSSLAALPAGANPATDFAGAVGIPRLAYYASDDDTAIPATVTTLVSNVGGSAVSVGAHGHGDPAIAFVPTKDVIDFFAAHLLG